MVHAGGNAHRKKNPHFEKKKLIELDKFNFMCVYVNVRNGPCHKHMNVKMCITDYSSNPRHFVLYKLCERKRPD